MKTPGQHLASMRRTVKHICPICGAEFEGLSTRKTCSDKCRQKLSRIKKAPVRG